MGHEEAVLPEDKGTGVVREGGQVAPKVYPMMCYSPRIGQYGETCATTEYWAIEAVFGPGCDDGVAIQLLQADIRHSHRPNGDCIPVLYLAGSRAASDCRIRMARAYVAGHNMEFR